MRYCILLLLASFFITKLYGVAKPAHVPAKSTKGDTWVVVVGIARYKHIPSLNYADRDAIAFYNYLTKNDGGPQLNASHVKLLVNENAPAYLIYGALDWLEKSTKPGDHVIFYFSGHGDQETKTQEPKGYLLAYDSPQSAYDTYGTISIDLLLQYLDICANKNKASSVILIADACRAGLLAGGSNGRKQTLNALKQPGSKGIVKILSAQENETSIESAGWGQGHGAFSYYLLKGIEGAADHNNDHQVSASELADYLAYFVAKATDNVQHPLVDGAGDKQLFNYGSPGNESENKADELLTGIGNGLDGELPQSVSDKYTKYLQYIKKEQLLWGDKKSDTINCARHLYYQLWSGTGAKILRPSLQSSFYSALQRKTQENLDNYIKGKLLINNPLDSYREIHYLSKIITPGYILYNYIMARYQFMRYWALVREHKAYLGDMALHKVLLYDKDAPYANDELSEYYLDHNNLIAASKYAENAREIAPNWANPYLVLGMIDDDHKNFASALSNYHKSLVRDSNSSGAYCNIGITYQQLGKYDTALIFHKKALQLMLKYSVITDYTNNYNFDSQRIIYTDIGIDYQFIGQIDTAMKYYKDAIRVAPNYASAYVNLGYNYLAKKELDSALKYSRRAIAIAPQNPDVNTNLGLAYIYKKQFIKGLKYLKKVIMLKPNDFTGYYNLACGYSIEGLSEKSVTYLKMAIKKGFKDYNGAMNDEDLANARKNDAFAALIKKYSKKI